MLLLCQVGRKLIMVILGAFLSLPGSQAKVLWSHAGPTFWKPSVNCPHWPLWRWLLSLPLVHSDLDAVYWFLCLTYGLMVWLFAAGISPQPQPGSHLPWSPLHPSEVFPSPQGTATKGHVGSIPASPPSLGTSLPSPWSSESLFFLLRDALFSLYTLISLLSVKNLIVVNNRKYSSNWLKSKYIGSVDSKSKCRSGFRLRLIQSAKKKWIEIDS